MKPLTCPCYAEPAAESAPQRAGANSQGRTGRPAPSAFGSLTGDCWLVAIVLSVALTATRPARGQPAGSTGGAASQPAGPVAAGPGATPSTDAPRLVVEQPNHEFGRTPAGRDIRCEFVVENTGKSNLEILEIKPACGCTTSGGYDKVIPPGGRTKILIHVATKSLRGKIDKTVEIVTNAPKPAHAVLLHVRGEVWLAIEATPNTVGFGRLSSQEAAKAGLIQKTIIVNHAPVPAKLKIRETGSAAFEGTIGELEPGRKFELAIALKPPLAGGVTAASLQIDTGLDEQPLLEVPVNVYVTADVEVFPSRLAVPFLRKSDLERRFTVVNNSATPMSLSDLKTSNPALQVRMEEAKPGSTFVVLVKIPRTYKATTTGDTISFKTNLPTSPSVSVPIVLASAANAPLQPMQVQAGAGLTKLPGGDVAAMERRGAPTSQGAPADAGPKGGP